MNPCADNVQYLDSFGVSRYLASYIASIDKCQRVFIRPPSKKTKQCYSMEVEETGNTKIAGVPVAEAEKKKKKTKDIIEDNCYLRQKQ